MIYIYIYIHTYIICVFNISVLTIHIHINQKVSKFTFSLLRKILRHRCFPEVCNIIKKGTLTQGFSCEFCEIYKNTFCYRTPPVATSVCCRRKVVTFSSTSVEIL